MVCGGGFESQAAPEGGAPQTDPRGVDTVDAAGECQRSRQVFELSADTEHLSFSATAVTETAIVEGQGCDSRVGKAFGETAQGFLAGGREPVGHDHDRHGTFAARPIEPHRALVPAEGELQFFPDGTHTATSR